MFFITSEWETCVTSKKNYFPIISSIIISNNKFKQNEIS